MIHSDDLKLTPFSFGLSEEPSQQWALAPSLNDGQIQHGIWECGPGTFELEFEWSETAFILSGRAEVENTQTGETFSLTPGTLVQFARGSVWKWRVPWQIRKVFTSVV